eukprot:2491023-Lingulodinium_polyedra.AAC.1
MRMCDDLGMCVACSSQPISAIQVAVHIVLVGGPPTNRAVHQAAALGRDGLAHADGNLGVQHQEASLPLSGPVV